MDDVQPLSRNLSPKWIKVGIKRQIRAGDELSFSVVDDFGTKHTSHTLRFEQGRYRVRCAVTGHEIKDGFATMAAAQRAGFAASHERMKEIL